MGQLTPYLLPLGKYVCFGKTPNWMFGNAVLLEDTSKSPRLCAALGPTVLVWTIILILIAYFVVANFGPGGFIHADDFRSHPEPPVLPHVSLRLIMVILTAAECALEFLSGQTRLIWSRTQGWGLGKKDEGLGQVVRFDVSLSTLGLRRTGLDFLRLAAPVGTSCRLAVHFLALMHFHSQGSSDLVIKLQNDHMPWGVIPFPTLKMKRLLGCESVNNQSFPCSSKTS